MAVTALVTGVLAVALSWVPSAGWIITLLTGIPAVVFGILATSREPDKKGIAITGMLLGGTGVMFSVVWIAVNLLFTAS